MSSCLGSGCRRRGHTHVLLCTDIATIRVYRWKLNILKVLMTTPSTISNNEFRMNWDEMAENRRICDSSLILCTVFTQHTSHCTLLNTLQITSLQLGASNLECHYCLRTCPSALLSQKSAKSADLSFSFKDWNEGKQTIQSFCLTSCFVFPLILN